MGRHSVDFGETSWAFTPDKVHEAVEYARAHGLTVEWRDSNPNGQGLTLRVGPRSAAWYARLRVDGKMVGHKLGRAEGPGRLSVDDARKALQRHRFGVEPAAQLTSGGRRPARCAARIGETFDAYLKAAKAGNFSMRVRSKSKLSEKTAAGFQSIYNVHLSAHKDRSLSWLAEHGADLFEELGDRGQPALANQLQAVIKAVFEYARRNGIWTEANPVVVQSDKFAKHTIRARDVNLDDDQMAALLRAMSAEPEPFGDLLMTMAYTGQRAMNVCSLKWEQLDLERGTVKFKASSRKNRRADTLPLAKTVVKMLKARKHAQGDSGCEWVFPSPRSRKGHITTYKFAWKRVLERAGLEGVEDLVVHGLRHNLGSWGQESGVADGSVTAALGHASSRSTERYRHGKNIIVARPAVEAVASRLDKAAKKKATKRTRKS